MTSHSPESIPAPMTTLSEVEELGRERDEYRLSLAELGYTPGRIEYLVGRRFGRQIASMAMRADIESLLQPQTTAPDPVERPATELAKWARKQYEEHGRDDIRSRQLPPSDRD